MSQRGGGSGDSNWGIQQQQHQRSSSSPKPTSPHTWASVCGPNPSQVVNSRSNCDKPLDTILAAENWGNTVINQEKSWDLSPSNVVDHHVLPSNEWRNASISGTEIWESSVRHKAKPSNNPAVAANATSSSGGGTVGGSSSSSSSQSWNHTPSTHIGGTWGEEDADASSLWTGVPMPNGSSSHSVFSANNASNGNWGSNSKADAIGSNGSEPTNSSSWKDTPRSDETSSRNGNQSNNWAPWGEAVSEATRAPLKQESTSNERLGTTLWGCDTLGTNSNSNISSNSNNSSSGSSNHNHNPAPATKSTIRSSTISSDSATSWKKESTSSNCSGWDEGEGSHFSASTATFTINGSTNGSTTSNASQGTNEKMSVFEDTSAPSKSRDDGTAVWGNPQTQQQQKIRRWKEEQSNMEMNVSMMGQNCANGLLAVPLDEANGSNGPVVIGGVSSAESPGLIRLPSASSSNTASKSTEPWIKSQTSSGHRSTGAWGDTNGTNLSGSSNNSNNCRPASEWGQASMDAPSDAKNHRGWGESGDAPSSPGPMWGKSKNPSSSWSDGQVDTSSWSGSKQKPLTKEMIYASKQFRLLTDNLGYKKDDVEMALRASNMNIDESLQELKSWVSSEENKSKMSPVPGNTPPSLLLSGGLSNASLHNSSSSSSSIAPSNCGTNNAVNSSSICAALRAPPSLPNQQSLPSVNQMKSALGVKSGQLGPGASLTGSLNGGTSQPSDRQLYHLVNQIQLAVQSGHLNAQILNQPLAPQTVHLIYTLLQSIKHLLTLQSHLNKSMQQQTPANQAIQPHLHVQITKTKQTISNLQNQIHLTQSMFLKQQSQQSLNALTSNSNSSSTVTSPVNSSSSQAFSMDVLKSQMTQEVTSSTHQLPTDFGNLSLKDPPNQSRLKTWKLPTYDKTDVDSDLFSRAPGSSKSAHSSGLPSRSDSTWSTLASAGDCWSTWSGDHQASNDSLFKEHQSSTSVGAASVNASTAAAAVAAAAAAAASSATPTHQMSPYLSDLAVPEFEPGKPWKGSSQLKSIEDDPTVTPGSVNRSPLSVNNIFNTWSKGSPTESTANDSLSSLSFSSSNTWSFTPSASSSALSTFASCDPTKSGGNKGSVTAWSSIGETPSSDSLWGNNSTSNTSTISNTSNKPRGPPPGLSAKTQMNGQFVTQEYSLSQLL